MPTTQINVYIPDEEWVHYVKCKEELNTMTKEFFKKELEKRKK